MRRDGLFIVRTYTLKQSQHLMRSRLFVRCAMYERCVARRAFAVHLSLSPRVKLLSIYLGHLLREL